MFRRQKENNIKASDPHVITEQTRNINKPKSEVPFEIIPERMRTNYDLAIGNIACGVIDWYSFKNGKLYGTIDGNVNFFIKQENFFPLPSFTEFTEDAIPNTIRYSIGKKVCGRVISKDSNGIELDRLSVIEKTVDILSKQIGTTIQCTIESIAPYGVFVDLGNGVDSLVHVTELSQARYFDLKKYFTVGDKIKVKLLEYDHSTKQFKASSKAAYNKLALEACSIIRAKVCEKLNDEGYFVEVNPATIGILDVPSDLKLLPRQEVTIFVKKITESGFRSDLIKAY